MPFLAAVVVGDRSMDDADDDTAACCRLLIDAFERCIVGCYCYSRHLHLLVLCFCLLAAVSFETQSGHVGISMWSCSRFAFSLVELLSFAFSLLKGRKALIEEHKAVVSSASSGR